MGWDPSLRVRLVASKLMEGKSLLEFEIARMELKKALSWASDTGRITNVPMVMRVETLDDLGVRVSTITPVGTFWVDVLAEVITDGSAYVDLRPLLDPLSKGEATLMVRQEDPETLVVTGSDTKEEVARIPLTDAPEGFVEPSVASEGTRINVDADRFYTAVERVKPVQGVMSNGPGLQKASMSIHDGMLTLVGTNRTAVVRDRFPASIMGATVENVAVDATRWIKAFKRAARDGERKIIVSDAYVGLLWSSGGAAFYRETLDLSAYAEAAEQALADRTGDEGIEFPTKAAVTITKNHKKAELVAIQFPELNKQGKLTFKMEDGTTETTIDARTSESVRSVVVTPTNLSKVALAFGTTGKMFYPTNVFRPIVFTENGSAPDESELVGAIMTVDTKGARTS